MSDFDTFFDDIKQLATAFFQKKGEHLPLFYLRMPETDIRDLSILSAAWDDSEDKERKFLLVRTGIELGAVRACCLVHEMWFAEYKKPESGAVDIERAPLPSTMPNRKEMLMIVGVDRDTHRIGYWEIKRSGTKRKPQLGEFQLMDESMMPISDAFRGLIKSDGRLQ